MNELVTKEKTSFRHDSVLIELCELTTLQAARRTVPARLEVVSKMEIHLSKTTMDTLTGDRVKKNEATSIELKAICKFTV